jgi:hypothetical protein
MRVAELCDREQPPRWQLAKSLRTRRASELRKSDLLYLARVWQYRSDIWRLKSSSTCKTSLKQYSSMARTSKRTEAKAAAPIATNTVKEEEDEEEDALPLVDYTSTFHISNNNNNINNLFTESFQFQPAPRQRSLPSRQNSFSDNAWLGSTSQPSSNSFSLYEDDNLFNNLFPASYDYEQLLLPEAEKMPRPSSLNNLDLMDQFMLTPTAPGGMGVSEFFADKLEADDLKALLRSIESGEFRELMHKSVEAFKLREFDVVVQEVVATNDPEDLVDLERHCRNRRVAALLCDQNAEMAKSILDEVEAKLVTMKEQKDLPAWRVLSGGEESWDRLMNSMKAMCNIAISLASRCNSTDDVSNEKLVDGITPTRNDKFLAATEGKREMGRGGELGMQLILSLQAEIDKFKQFTFGSLLAAVKGSKNSTVYFKIKTSLLTSVILLNHSVAEFDARITEGVICVPQGQH